jgi:Zn-dependent metalloprotease
VSGIGRPAAEWIFFRALRKLTPYANFSNARIATLSAAADGYGLYSGTWYAVKSAWDAVGVYRRDAEYRARTSRRRRPPAGA